MDTILAVPGLRRVAVAAALAAVAVMAIGEVAASAHPLPHGDEPRIMNPRPAPGTVVQAGSSVRVSAMAGADREVVDHEIRVDGEEVAAERGRGTHTTVHGTVSLEPGAHDIEVSAATDHGETSRSWRVHAVDFSTQRLAGPERLATAVEISRDLYPDGGGAQGAVLARADDFPDALAGAPVARQVDGPLLLTSGSGLSGITRAELERAVDPGGTVTLLGGSEALGGQVASDVRDLGFDTRRLHGEDRFETAAEAAELLPETGTAIVASGGDFPDALAAAAVAGDRGWPILLTSSGGLDDAVEQVLVDGGFDQVFLVGGSAVIGSAVETALGSVVGDVERVAGDSRFATARALSERFFDEADALAVASGRDFPDALAGGVHAAAYGMPLALVAGDRLFDAQRQQVQAGPDSAVLYGGAAAVPDRVPEALRAAAFDSGDLRVTDASLNDGAVVDELETITFRFNQSVYLPHSHVHVTIDDNEVGGSVGHAGSTDTLRLSVDDLPGAVEHGETHDVHVRMVATSGSSTVHDQLTVSFRLPHEELARGASGSAVADLQRNLRSRGFWLPNVNGQFDSHTHHAVVAAQKTHGLDPDGIVDADTRRAIERGSGPSARSRPGDGVVYEINLERQILMRVVNGDVRQVFDTSTGHGRVYEFQGSTYRANTTTGRHTISFQRNYSHEAARGVLYRPKYYDTSRGIAIHGSSSVPPYPASAGCIRVTNAAMDFLWRNEPNVGNAVWVYPSNYY